MVTRLPYAAATLMQEVQEMFPKAESDTYGEPDGFGIHRTVRFDKATSKKLAPIMERVGDPRIQEVTMTDAGYLHVTFVPASHQADTRHGFPLQAAASVLKAEGARKKAAAPESRPDDESEPEA